MAGDFSAVLEDDEAVGRIIRARNPSSAGALKCDKLCLEGGLLLAGGGPSDGLLLPLFTVEGFLTKFDDVVVALVRLGERDSD